VGYRAAEALASLARFVLLGANAQVAFRREVQRLEAVLLAHDLDDWVLILESRRLRLDHLRGQFVEMGRMLAVAFPERFTEQPRLHGRVVRAGATLAGVEDRVSELARELAQLRLETRHRDLVIE